MWIYPITFLLTIFFLLYKYYTRNFDYWKKRNVFYLKPVPFFGNLLTVFTNTDEPLGKSLMNVCKAAKNLDFFGFFVFDRPTLLVTSPKLTKAILQKDASNFIDRTIAESRHHPVMSNLLFFQKNPLWREVRTKISPVFTSGKLKMMFPLMVKESKELTEYISTIANIPDIESKEICAKFSTNVTTRCAFSVDANSFKDENAIFRTLGRQMFDFRISTALRQLGGFFQPNIFETLRIPFFDPKILEPLKGIFADVVNSRKASKNLQGNDLIDILLEGNRTKGDRGFSETGMLGQAIQFFAAGFETVSATLGYSLYELCVNPNIQEKVRKEINDCLEKEKDITYEAMQELKYLDMCVSETLRKYPPIPFLDRTCKENYKIEGSDFVIEKGTPIYIPTFALHYNPKYFPDPDAFIPERFTDKSNINQDGLWYIPFGEGPRICIGQRFGLLVVKMAIVAILSKYRLEKSEKTPVPIKFEKKSLVLQSTIGIPLKFVPL